MRKLNLIVVFNKDLSKGLFCIRAKAHTNKSILGNRIMLGKY